MKFLINTLLVLFVACGSTSQNNQAVETKSLKIKKVEEFSHAFGILTEDMETANEVYVVSFKESFYEKHSMPKPNLSETEIIEPNKILNFKLLSVKPQVSQMQDLGAYMIVENDTLLRAPTYKQLPDTFNSTNSVGLIVEKPR